MTVVGVEFRDYVILVGRLALRVDEANALEFR